MAFGKPADNAPPKIKKENIFTIIPLAILTFVLLFSGVFVPQFLYDLINEASALLGG